MFTELNGLPLLYYQYNHTNTYLVTDSYTNANTNTNTNT